jgi:hypothetical protein
MTRPSKWKKRSKKPMGVKEAAQKKREVYQVRRPEVLSPSQGTSVSEIKAGQERILKKIYEVEQLMIRMDVYLNPWQDDLK